MANMPLRRQGILERRREDVRRIDSMTVKVTRVSGRLLVTGVGGLSVDVKFPVRFCERPIFTFGGELDDNHRPTAGQFPSLTAVVVDWEKVGEIEGGPDGYYIGATLALNISGRSDQAIWVHWVMEGKAIRNPLNNLDDTDSTL